MNLLWKQTKGELKKTFTRKEGKLSAKLGLTAIITTAISLFVLLGFLMQLMGGGTSTPRTVTKADCIQLIDYYVTEQASAEYISQNAYDKSTQEFYLLQAQACKDNIAILRYAIDNNIDSTKFTIALASINGNGVHYLGRRSWAFENLTINQEFLMAINSIFLVYVVLVTCSAFGDDYKKRTIRMLALRPMTRSRILGVKTLAVTVHLTLAALAVFLMQIILNALSVGLDFTTIIIGMSGRAIVLHPAIYLPWIFLNQLITVLFFMTLCIALCVVLKSKVLPLVIGVVLTQAGAGISYAAQAYGQRIALWTWFLHTDLNQYLAYGSAFSGMNYFASLFVVVFYAALFTLLAHYVFRRRDIA